mgnify:CR=1 FL=1
MTKVIQSSFSRGEIGPALYGRVNIDFYQNSLRRANNMFVHQFGGISNRPGFQFIGPVKDQASAPRLVEFQFKSTDTHILEFGNQYIRFIRNDAHITEAAKTISGATNANPIVVTASSHGYSNGDEVYISGVVGMTQINGNRFKVASSSTHTFALQDVYSGGNVDGTGMGTYGSAGTSSRIYEVASPYLTAELPLLKFAQTADTLTIVHPDHNPRTLKRSALASWALAEIAFSPTIADPTAVTASGGSGAATYYTVTSHSEDEEESLQGVGVAPAASTISAITKADPGVVTCTGAHGLVNGDLVEITAIVGMTELNNRRFTVANKATTTFELRGEDTTNFTTWSSAGTVTPCFTTSANSTGVTITWTGNDDAIRYSIYKLDAGVMGWIGSSAGNSFLDTGILADTSTTPPTFTEPFILDGYKPGAVAFHQQRSVMGGSLEKPDTSWFSVIGSANNFSRRSPATETDGFSTTVASREINEIRHYVSLGDLLVFTSGAEWAFRSGSGDSRFSIATISQEPQTSWGCSQIPPIVIGNKVLFISETGTQVRASGYTFQDDAYSASEVSILVPHLFRNRTSVDWAFVEAPEPLIYMIMSDGNLNVLTFNEEQSVVGWSTMETEGSFESIAAIRPSINSTSKEAYVVVKRVINGNTVRFIERTHDRDFEDVEDCFFVDAGLSLDSPSTISAFTLASPGVLTVTGHPFLDDDEVDITGIVWATTEDVYGNVIQPDQLNKKRFIVDNKTANTFTLVNKDTGVAVDSTLFQAYVSGGEVRKAVSTVTGLHQLPNTLVNVLADGNVIKNLTVSAYGEITLPRKFSRVHVGLPYTSEIETLDPESSISSRGTQQSKFKNISTVTVRFERSRGMWIGPTVNDLVEMKQREFEPYGSPTDLKTGDEITTITSRWNRSGRLVIRQRDPLPMSILAIIPDILVNREQ